MLGKMALGTTVVRAGTTKDTIKAALVLASGSVGAGTDNLDDITGSSEVSGTNYTAGGVTVTNATEPTSTSTTAHWTPSASISFTTVTLSTAFDAVLLYNSSQSNKAIAVYTFGSQTITAGTFTLTMPTNDNSTGLLRLA
jgi:hypothetical protein